MKEDICPRCHSDRNYEHERDGSNMCWCGDLLTVHIKESDVDDLALLLNRYLMADGDFWGPRPLAHEILDQIKEWKKSR